MNNEDNSYNKVIIIGLITSFLLPVIGIIITILGLKSMKYDNTKGKGLAAISFLIAPIILFIHIYFIVWPYAYDKYFKDKIDDYKEQKKYSEICKTIDPGVCYPYNDEEVICAYKDEAIECPKDTIKNRNKTTTKKGETTTTSTTTTTTETISIKTTKKKTTETTTTEEADDEVIRIS